MEVIKYAAVAAMIATPAMSKQQECYPAEPSLEAMTENGYSITFGDTSQTPFFMAEDGEGGWVMFALVGDALCPIVGGSSGIHTPLPPNT